MTSDPKPQIRKLRLTAKRLIHQFGEGSFRTMFQGRGIEFAGLREYVAGDEIRRIDWNTTARRGTPFVKTFTEEHDLSILLALDLSSSMDSKRNSFAGVVSLIAFLAETNEDRIGCLGFTDKVEFFMPPRKRANRPEQILHRALTFQKTSRKTSIHQALSYLRRVLKKQVILFLISDFFDLNFEASFLSLSAKHEIVGVYLYNPLEARLSGKTIVSAFDPESGKTYFMDGYDPATRKGYQSVFENNRKKVSGLFAKSRSDLLILPADDRAPLRFIQFLQRRQSFRGPLQVVQS